MYATRSPRPTPIAWRADDHRSHRSKNSSYVRRRSPSTTPSRSPYSLRVRRANSRGVSGVSIPVPPSRIEHESEVGVPDPADERAVGLGLELDRALVHEGVDVVDRPVAVALYAHARADALPCNASPEEVGGARVDGLQDLQLHAELGDCLGVALRLHELLDLCFEVGDPLLVVVHLKVECTPAISGSGSWTRSRPRSGWR